MARRDNKTEHVMKLITKDGTVVGGVSESGVAEIGAIETEVRPAEGSPPSYKTKLKIEIEPEVEVKEPNRLRQPRGQSVSVSARDTDADDSRPPEYSEDSSSDAPEYGDALESIPDGTPYEMLNMNVKPAAPVEILDEKVGSAPPAETVNKNTGSAPSFGMLVFDEVKALRESDNDMLKQDELRRAKKMQIENSLLNKSRSLINLSEVLTKELLPSVMERMDVCTCPVCTGNVLALALNSLPTKYVTTDEGKQYTQLEVYKRQNELDVMAALTRACLRVKGSPRHEIIDDLNE
ncbi:MAG: late competence development ComFB family protein [Clostridiales Family XIII bacterium]|jgi:competence protein ComFB|nr:late competence development ComFB family protein [Clostridiales Family XIII bacterium]